MSRSLLDGDLGVVSAGVSLFADALTAQAVDVEVVDWRPPMPGAEQALSRVMADPRRERANEIAVGRMLDRRRRAGRCPARR